MTSKQQEAYKLYGDILIVDATYCTNKYKLPFINLVILDNNGRIRHIGAALVTEEDIPSYTWVFEILQEVTKCTPRVTISDQARQITGSLDNVYSDSTVHLKCDFHLHNILAQHVPKNWDRSTCQQFIQDFHFVENSASMPALEDRWRELENRYCTGNREFSEKLERYFRIRDSWAPNVRAAHHALYRASSIVESSHGSIKKFVDSTSSLIEVIEASVQVSDSQWHQNRICAELQSRLSMGQCLSNMRLDRMIQAVKKMLTDVAIRSLYSTMGKASQFCKDPRLSSESFESLLVETQNNVSNLPSMQGVVTVQDIPPRITLLARHEDSLIYRVMEKRHGEIRPAYLPFGSHLVVYRRNTYEYDCTCGENLLWGMLCEHFLIVYETSNDVWHHAYLWHPRWLKSPPSPAQMLELQSEVQMPKLLTGEVAADVIGRSCSLFGPLRGDERPNAQVEVPLREMKIEMTRIQNDQVRVQAVASRLDELGQLEKLRRLAQTLEQGLREVCIL
jgi:hypothetical protein